MQDYLQALHTENLICRTVPPTLFARLLAAQPCPLADVEIGDINALDPGGDIADYNLCALLLDGLSASADVDTIIARLCLRGRAADYARRYLRASPAAAARKSET